MSAPIRLADFIELSKKYEERGRTIEKLEQCLREGNRMVEDLLRESARRNDRICELKAELEQRRSA